MIKQIKKLSVRKFSLENEGSPLDFTEELPQRGSRAESLEPNQKMCIISVCREADDLHLLCFFFFQTNLFSFFFCFSVPHFVTATNIFIYQPCGMNLLSLPFSFSHLAVHFIDMRMPHISCLFYHLPTFLPSCLFFIHSLLSLFFHDFTHTHLPFYVYFFIYHIH